MGEGLLHMGVFANVLYNFRLLALCVFILNCSTKCSSGQKKQLPHLCCGLCPCPLPLAQKEKEKKYEVILDVVLRWNSVEIHVAFFVDCCSSSSWSDLLYIVKLTIL